MRESGRISFLGGAGIVAVFVLAILLLFGSRESPTTAGARFLTALGKHDVDTLTKMSYMGDMPEAQVRQEWETTFKYTKHFFFGWHLVTSADQGPDQATVTISYRAPLDDPSSYDQNQQLKLQKVDGKWKVAVRSLNREIFPNLPR